MKYRHKPTGDLVEIVSFDELVEHGRRFCHSSVGTMPWSFTWNGKPVSHETDDCYLVGDLSFRRGQAIEFHYGSGRVFAHTDPLPTGWEPVDGTPTPGYSGQDVIEATEKSARMMLDMAGLAKTAGQLKTENERLRKDLDIEQMRLAACGAIALSDTPESAAAARQMHPDYRSASLTEVERRVDECIKLRGDKQRLGVENVRLTGTVGELKADLERVTVERDRLVEQAAATEVYIKKQIEGPWAQLQAALPEPAADDDRSLVERILDAISEGRKAMGTLAEMEGLEGIDAGAVFGHLDPSSYPNGVVVYCKVLPDGRVVPCKSSGCQNAPTAKAPDPQPVWCQVEGCIDTDLMDHRYVVFTGSSYTPQVALILCNRHPDGSFTPIARGFLPTYKIPG